MSKSPPGPLEFELLLEKTRACNLAIRSLISLINAEVELRKGRRPEWELFVEAAHLLSAEELGIVDDVFPPEMVVAIRTENHYYREYMEEIGSQCNDAGESPGRGLAPGDTAPPKY